MTTEKKKRIVSLIVAAVIYLGANVLFCFTLWLLSKYDDVNFDQILFQFKSSTEGAHKSLINSAAFRVGVLGCAFSVIGYLAYALLSGGMAPFVKKAKGYIRFSGSKFCKFMHKRLIPIVLVALVISCCIFVGELDVLAYVKTIATNSDFIEENYVDPNSVDLAFPEKKRNLVYIILESMETTYAEEEAGGPIKTDYIPELRKLAEENVNFSHDNDLGGAFMYTGSSWTAGSLVAQTAGIVIKVPLTAEYYGGHNEFIEGVTSIGEILDREGYEQVFVMGSDADFAGRRTYFEDHGNYNILDTDNLKAEGRLPADYDEWWGYEDIKVFQYAKEEITRLAKEDKPFNLTLLTADTHFPDGYLCPLCENEHDNQYANVVSCCSKQTYEFVSWIQSQDFYKDTTIVIVGDHLTMDPAFLDGMNPDYVRSTYSCIINPAAEAENTKNRQYSLMDMYPTTLAAMGVDIEGDKLALGVNLFSGEKTLTEIYGMEALDEELLKHSDYYNEYFLGMK